jgi:hypothetical protein
MPKISLKPVETQLKKIRNELETESMTATAKKKKALKGKIKKLDKVIAVLPKICKQHDVG